MKTSIILATPCPHCNQSIVCDERNTTTMEASDGTLSLSKCYKCGKSFYVTITRTGQHEQSSMP